MQVLNFNSVEFSSIMFYVSVCVSLCIVVYVCESVCGGQGSTSDIDSLKLCTLFETGFWGLPVRLASSRDPPICLLGTGVISLCHHAWLFFYVGVGNQTWFFMPGKQANS